MCHKRQKNKKEVNVLWSKPDNTEEMVRKMWNIEHFVSYEKDLYSSLCFNNLMINEEIFHIRKEVKCDYNDFYNKYTVDMFNGNNPIINRKNGRSNILTLLIQLPTTRYV